MIGVSDRELVAAFQSLGIGSGRPVLAHASLSAFGEVDGGADALLDALVKAFAPLVMPAFTYRTMVIPEAGPDGNGIAYGTGKDLNRLAQAFAPGMPVDRMIGRVAEALRRHPRSERSGHPIFSFTGIDAGPILMAQTLEEPLAPIGAMAEQGGWVLLLGVDQTSNTTIHYAEKLSGRKQFLRWALTAEGVRACSGFPGCSDGFEAISPHVKGITQTAQIGKALVQALPMDGLIEAVRAQLARDPLALLCARPACERCDEVRRSALL